MKSSSDKLGILPVAGRQTPHIESSSHSCDFRQGLLKGPHIATGQSSDTDTVVANAKASVSALKNLIVRRAKTKPEELISVL